MLTATIPAAALLMIVLPLAFAWAVTRRLRTPVSLLLCGAMTFLVAQAVRTPALQGLTSLFSSGALPAPEPANQVAVNIAILSLTAGFFEEGARYIAYRHLIPRARSWNAAVTFGAGHGAMESIVLGAIMAFEFAVMLAAATPDALLPGQGLEHPATQTAAATARYWANPWFMPLLGALERAFSICFHLTMAVVVLKAVTQRRLSWLAAAMAAHFAANAAATAVLVAYGPIAAEIVVGLIAAAALLVLFRLRDTDPERPAAT